MAKVEYEVCDRCGEKINYHSRRLARVHTAKFKWIICGYIVESEKRLCKECTEKLDEFLSAK